MGNLRFVVAILALAACGSDNAAVDAQIVIHDAPIDTPTIDAPPDAPNYNFACTTTAMPTTATATITLSGTASEFDIGTMMLKAVTGVAVDTCKSGTNCAGQNKYGTQKTTDASGNFTTDALVNVPPSTPIDGFLRTTKTGYRPTNVYPPEPFTVDTAMIPVLTFTTTTFTALAGFLGATQDTNKGAVILAVTDCNLMPITGAAITVKQNGADVQGTTVVDAGQFGMGGGGFLVFNVPPGTTELNASYMGMTFLARNVDVVAGGTIETAVKPGY